MRAFKIWNKNRTSSFDLSGLNVITTDIAGLGNKFTNELYDGRIKKHLINQHNSFEQINLTVNFGVNSNAYQKYREFMNFIQANGRNILVIEYYTPGASRFVDVVLSNASKSQKTGFGVLVETVSFDRLTPYYILQRRTGRSVLVSNRYLENVVPRLELKNNLYPAGTKIRTKSKNETAPILTGKTDLGGGNYRLYNNHGITFDYNVYNSILTINGTATQDLGTYTIFNNGIVNPQQDTYYTLKRYDIQNKPLEFITLVFNETLSVEVFSVFSTKEEVTGLIEAQYQNIIGFYVHGGMQFNNYQFKLQLEKAGNTLELDRPIDELNGYTLREVFETIIPDYWYNDLSNNQLPNGVRNEIVGSYYVQRVKKYTIQASDITYTGDSPTHSFFDLPKPLDYIRYGISVSGYGDMLIDGFIENDTIYLTLLLSNEYTNYNSPDYTKIALTLGTTLAEAQADLAGTEIYYQLATPIETILDFTITTEQMDHWFNQYQTLKETPTEYSKPVTDTREIELNETILSNQELIIDSENKSITLNGVNAYQITNKDKSTFLNLPEGDYLVECDTPITVEYKRWVID